MAGERGERPKAPDEARILRIAPSTNPDGLDLTVAEFHAMSTELRRRTFGVAGFEEVPLVHRGHFLDRAPKGRNEDRTMSFVRRHDEYDREPGRKAG